MDGLAALVMGKLFDVCGIALLAWMTALASLFAPLVFWGGFHAALIGMILWGIGMGAQESIMRAVVPSLVPPERRGVAYGLLNLTFGLFWAGGSALMGILYDISFFYLVVFSIIAQLAAVPIFLIVKMRLR